MDKISLDKLIGNLQTYELRRSSQQKEETKKGQDLALKALEEDGSDLNEEEMAMITRKFKKFFKKAKENSKKKNFSKSRSNKWEQFTWYFKCGKHDHIVKNCLLLKETGARTVPKTRHKTVWEQFCKAFLKGNVSGLG